jgi:hypothetical protein
MMGVTGSGCPTAAWSGCRAGEVSWAGGWPSPLPEHNWVTDRRSFPLRHGQGFGRREIAEVDDGERLREVGRGLWRDGSIGIRPRSGGGCAAVGGGALLVAAARRQEEQGEDQERGLGATGMSAGNRGIGASFHILDCDCGCSFP